MTPNSTSARLSMLARTGRRMDRSEIFMSESGSQVSTLRFLPGLSWPKWWIHLPRVDRGPRKSTANHYYGECGIKIQPETERGCPKGTRFEDAHSLCHDT